MIDGVTLPYVSLRADQMARICGRILHRYGFQLQAYQQRLLETGVSQRMQATAMRDADAYISRLLTLPDELQELIELLLNHETVFFRNMVHSHVLRTILLPALRDRAEIRIWSAGCATGEESYSLAIMAAEVFGVDVSRVHIFATDLSRAALHKAERGVYNGRTITGLTPAQRARWFTPCEDGLQVAPELRKMVTFLHHNLLDAPRDIPVADIISCQNVLIYLHNEANQTVLRHLRSRMHAESVLLLGFSESLWQRDSALVPQEIGGTYVHRVRPTSQPAPSPRPPRKPPHDRSIVELEQARAYANREAFDAAQQVLDAVLELNPHHRAALTLIGDIAMRRQRWAEAVAALEQARQLAPIDPLIAYRLAESYRQLGHRGQAIRTYRLTIDLLRGHPPNMLLDDVAPEWIQTTCNRWLLQLEKGISTGL